MVERATSAEKFGVIFAIYLNKELQMEYRSEPDDEFFGFFLIPGGGVNSEETYERAMKREVFEEFGARPLVYEKVGKIVAVENGITNFRHVFLITKLDRRLGNPEKRNLHLGVTLIDAKTIGKHPVTQKILDLIEDHLFRKDQ